MHLFFIEGTLLYDYENISVKKVSVLSNMFQLIVIFFIDFIWFAVIIACRHQIEILPLFTSEIKK